MGVPWLAQVRLSHLAMLGAVTLTMVLYVSYTATPPPTATGSPPARAPANRSVELRMPGANATAAPAQAQAQAHNASSEAPPARTRASEPAHAPPAQQLYEPGHEGPGERLCPAAGAPLRLLIAVTSAPGHDAARAAIRDTWGRSAARRDVAVAFVLGTTFNATVAAGIEREQFLYGDIIRGNFVDTYDNLTLKTISMLEWVDAHCPRADFVLKTDDDMFINVPKLLGFIDRHRAEERAIYGRLAKKWKPIRNKKSKYYISPQQYKPAVFPDFTTGPAYLFPAQLSREMYTAALNHTYFKLEDVFLTGIVADSLKIKRVYAPEFLNKRVSLTTCSLQKGISIHMVKGIEQYDIWKKLHDIVTKCK